MILRKTSSKASAPAKIILFGEHFVVYGNYAILASINKRVNVTVNLNKTQTINIKSDLGIMASYTDSKFNLVRGGKNTKEILDPLSLQILEGKFHEGQTIRVDERQGKLVFEAR